MMKILPAVATLANSRHRHFVLGIFKLGQQRLASEGGITQAVMEQDLARWILK